MKRIVFWSIALVVALCMSMSAKADTLDSLSTDTTLWYNQTQQLDGVVVKGRLPKTRVKGDAMRTTIAGTILEKAGTLSDALSKIPSLEAERDGGVKVQGRGEAEIYINGRKVQDVSELSRLRSDQIQHVDVVHNPGARYAASTKAVVRITLKKAQGEGFSFRDNAGAVYQYGHTLTNNLDMNYRTGGLDITASFWAGRYGHSKSLQEDDMYYMVGNDVIAGYSKQETTQTWKGLSPQLQVNYMVNENHSFGAFYKYDYHPTGKLTSQFNTDEYENGIFTERSESEVWQDDNFKKHIFNAYYNGKVGKLGIDLNIDGLFDDTETPGNTKENATAANGQKLVRNIESNTQSGNNFWASKLILSYPLWNGNFSLGGEYSHNRRTDAYSYKATEVVPVTATDTEINETSAAAFMEYGHAFPITLFGKPSMLYVQAGLRYEHLKNDYYNFGVRDDEVCRNYGDWFPTASISAPIGQVQLSLSYRRDIKRPAYSNLTSSTIYLNRYAYQSGNPYLKPTYTHSIVLNAGYKWMGMSINFSRIKDAETMTTEPFPGADDPLISLLRPINTKEEYNQLSFNPYVSPTINFQLSTFNCSWHPTCYIYLLFQNYKSPCADGSIITLNRPYLNLGWDNTIELHKGWRLNGSLRFNPKGDVGNFRILKAQGRVDLGVQHDVNLRSLGSLTLDVRCNDIFNSNETKAVVYGQRELTVLNPVRRTFSLDLTWKFNEARSKYRGSGAGEQQKARM
ncbi:MAG: TonB-dependent receptor [Prevotella sp.]|nr:TonB-dependent receptor [Prevotella sp.]